MPPNHLTWENFRSSILVPGEQRVHRVCRRPAIELFGDGNRHMVGLWVEVSEPVALPAALTRLASIQARYLEREGLVFLELGTASPALYRQFYHFGVAVAERIVTDRRAPLKSVEEELSCFADLLEVTSVLGTERQIGLLGELLFLERILALHGVDAVDSWLGPMGEPHDFRIGMTEVEVKTTVAPRRVHTINGAEQLVPSVGCSLMIASTMLGPPGSEPGVSLAQKARDIQATLGESPDRTSAFLAKLEAAGYREADAGHYNRTFALRRPLALIPVDSSFPALGRPAIQHVLGLSASRIESLQYDVDLEGLELEQGTPPVTLLLGADS